MPGNSLRNAVATAIFVAAAFCFIPAATQAQSEDTRVKQLIEQLKPLIDQAERAKAADPRFLQDLRAAIQPYEIPWDQTVLFDDFSDGNYDENPHWGVHSGSFSIDPKRGLRSVVDRSGGMAAAAPSGGDVSTTSGAISSGDNGNETAAMAFDDNPNTTWSSRRRGWEVPYSTFIGQDFGKTPRQIRFVSITQSTAAGVSQASAARVQRLVGNEWQTVANLKLDPAAGTQLAELPESGASTQWRLMPTATSGNGSWQVAEVEFMEQRAQQVAAQQQQPQTTSQPQGSGEQTRSQQPQRLEDLAVNILGNVLGGQRQDTAQQQQQQQQPQQQAQGNRQSWGSGQTAAEPAAGGTAGSPEPARIGTWVKVPETFSLALEVTSAGEQGQLLFGTFTRKGKQGMRVSSDPKQTTGFQVLYSFGSAPALRLIRIVDGQIQVLGAHEKAIPYKPGKTQTVQLDRWPDGSMVVSVDNTAYIKVKAEGFGTDFRGVVLTNIDGDIAVRSVKVMAAAS